MSIAVIDYGAGNLFSVKNALDYIGADSTVTSDPDAILSSSGIILPGVGAFPDAWKMLSNGGFVDVLRKEAERKPLLGICLGMQLLFDKSYEFGETEGLGLIPGIVKKFDDNGLKIPHMGWNSVKKLNDCPLAKDMNDGEYFYFVHSYLAVTDDENISLAAHYGETVPALVHRKNVYGAQFHPEKSGTVGLSMLRNFIALCENSER